MMKPIIVTSLLLIFVLAGSCASGRDFDTNLSSIVKPHLFSIAGWELRAIPSEIGQWIFSRQEKIDDEIGIVDEYFSATKRIKSLRSQIAAANAGSGVSDLAVLEAEHEKLQERKTALEGAVERIIEKQVRVVLSEQGIFNPITGFKVSFPPVNFKLEKPPYLLVVSPRESIESMREITLISSLVLEEIEDIEDKVDELDVSSLVIEIGGLATYPSLIANDARLQFTIDTAVEEWLHQYLMFKPLGFRYLLDLSGLSRSYEIATINETLASIVSKEIGAIVYQKYYSEYDDSVAQSPAPQSEFDFNRAMREIRKTVDRYLAGGEVEKAEEFMEEKRQYLTSQGFYIRKLNQAYFAFHGTYADRSTSISNVGSELKALRAQSASVKDFLDTVAVMTSRQEIKDSIK